MFIIFALLIVLNMCGLAIPQDAFAQQASVSFQVFYDNLSPYGMWVNYPNYGYVWIPNADPGFSPYATAGYWVYTEDGWTWVSDYPWGWAPFHYGRWDYDNGYGWFWVPDDEWGPAWVSWRSSPGYYGWAPLRPGISVNIAFGRDYHERNERWNFVRDRDITRPDIGSHYINRTNNATIIKNSTVIVNTQKDTRRNVAYIAGPNRDDVQKMTHTTIKAVAIRENDKPGQHLGNGELQIYRPQVQKMSGSGHNPVPSKVMQLKDIKAAPEKNAANRQQQPQKINPPKKNVEPQPLQPKANQQKQLKKEQPRTIVSPPPKVQTPQSRVVKPSNTMVKEKQPQHVIPPRKNIAPQPPQPRINQEEKRER